MGKDNLFCTCTNYLILFGIKLDLENNRSWTFSEGNKRLLIDIINYNLMIITHRGSSNISS